MTYLRTLAGGWGVLLPFLLISDLGYAQDESIPFDPARLVVVFNPERSGEPGNQDGWELSYRHGGELVSAVFRNGGNLSMDLVYGEGADPEVDARVWLGKIGFSLPVFETAEEGVQRFGSTVFYPLELRRDLDPEWFTGRVELHEGEGPSEINLAPDPLRHHLAMAAQGGLKDAQQIPSGKVNWVIVEHGGETYFDYFEVEQGENQTGGEPPLLRVNELFLRSPKPTREPDGRVFYGKPVFYDSSTLRFASGLVLFSSDAETIRLARSVGGYVDSYGRKIYRLEINPNLGSEFIWVGPAIGPNAEDANRAVLELSGIHEAYQFRGENEVALREVVAEITASVGKGELGVLGWRKWRLGRRFPQLRQTIESLSDEFQEGIENVTPYPQEAADSFEPFLWQIAADLGPQHKTDDELEKVLAKYVRVFNFLGAELERLGSSQAWEITPREREPLARLMAAVGLRMILLASLVHKQGSMSDYLAGLTVLGLVSAGGVYGVFEGLPGGSEVTRVACGFGSALCLLGLAYVLEKMAADFSYPQTHQESDALGMLALVERGTGKGLGQALRQMLRYWDFSSDKRGWTNALSCADLLTLDARTPDEVIDAARVAAK